MRNTPALLDWILLLVLTLGTPILLGLWWRAMTFLFCLGYGC